MIRIATLLLTAVLAMSSAIAADSAATVPPNGPATPAVEQTGPAAPAGEQMGPAAPAGGQLAAGLLRASPAFAALPDAAVAALTEQAEPHLLPGGEPVVREGDTTDSVFLLAAGRFAALRENAVLAPLGAGEIIGEYALLTGAPRTATVRALEDGLVFELPRAVLVPTLRAYPQVITAMSVLMAERLHRNDPQGPPKETIARDLEQTARLRLGL